MQEIPIYLFTGFMDSGKTTLIKEALLENGFADQGKSLRAGLDKSQAVRFLLPLGK